MLNFSLSQIIEIKLDFILFIFLNFKKSILSQIFYVQGKRAKAEPLKSWGEVDGKELALYDGRYGLYGKYGKDNFALRQDLKGNAEAAKNLSVEELLEMFKAYTPKKKTRKKK